VIRLVEERPRQGAQFVQWFGPVLDALLGFGHSGMPAEIIERMAKDQKVPDAKLNEVMWYDINPRRCLR
jgi:restriction system protein